MRLNYTYVLFVFFFFQAEDGIRDLTVTGVQTCALPIYVRGLRGRFSIRRLLLGEAADLAKLGCRTVRLHVLKVFQSRRCADAGYLCVAGCSCDEWRQSG